jgi:predicted nucleic acid-binding protein
VIRYLETSAVAKVIMNEQHTPALRAALLDWSADELVSSQLMATELHRLAARLGVPPTAATAVVSAVEVIDVEREDFIAARRMAPRSARALDVLHVAVAARVGADVIVTYDERQAEVAQSVGLAVVTPG